MFTPDKYPDARAWLEAVVTGAEPEPFDTCPRRWIGAASRIVAASRRKTAPVPVRHGAAFILTRFRHLDGLASSAERTAQVRTILSARPSTRAADTQTAVGSEAELRRKLRDDEARHASEGRVIRKAGGL